MAVSAFSYVHMKGSEAVEKKRESGFAVFFSGLCVLAALTLLLNVCGRCYPAMYQQIRTVFTGMEDGPVQRAFETLADGLENGEPVRETLAQTAQILLHE